MYRQHADEIIHEPETTASLFAKYKVERPKKNIHSSHQLVVQDVIDYVGLREGKTVSENFQFWSGIFKQMQLSPAGVRGILQESMAYDKKGVNGKGVFMNKTVYRNKRKANKK